MADDWDGYPDDDDEPRPAEETGFTAGGRGPAESGDRCGRCNVRLRAYDEYLVAEVSDDEWALVCENCEEALEE